MSVLETMAMLRMMAAAAALALVSGVAYAQTACTNSTSLSAVQIRSLLETTANRYACGTGNGEKWNENLRAGSQVWDNKLGTDSTTDPPSQVGSYVISTSSEGHGRIRYNYGPGAQFDYQIAPVAGTTPPSPGQYLFCRTGGGPVYSITVSNGPGAC